jgi:hypothetical protein
VYGPTNPFVRLEKKKRHTIRGPYNKQQTSTGGKKAVAFILTAFFYIHDPRAVYLAHVSITPAADLRDPPRHSNLPILIKTRDKPGSYISPFRRCEIKYIILLS